MNAIGEQISAILWNVFNRPRLIDLIDILLLTIIIYELLVHVRQTRVSQTIKGIIILLIATWLSDVLGMRTIHALLAWMINAGPVLLIVLFQSEIRRILEELGNNLLQMVVDTANGKQTKAESLGYTEMAIARVCNFV